MSKKITASGQQSQGAPDSSMDANETGFSLVRGDASYRLQRRLGLIPASGMGILRRAIIFAGGTWIPIVVWALLTHRMWGAAREEDNSLISQFGIHVRCLVAIPLLLLAEGLAQQYAPKILGHFVESGLVRTADLPQLRNLITDFVRLRDRLVPWVFIAGLAVAAATVELVWHPYATV